MEKMGTCNLCGQGFKRAGMTKHVLRCVETYIHDRLDSGMEEQNAYLIRFEDETKVHDLYVLVDERAPLKLLDDFLRGIWLECCEHVSEFNIDGIVYSDDLGIDAGFDLDYGIKDVLSVEDSFDYHYDLTYPTHIKGRVLAYYEGIESDDALTIVARNNQPQGALENSPRSGVCNYVEDAMFSPDSLRVEDYNVREVLSDDDQYDEALRERLKGYTLSQPDVFTLNEALNFYTRQELYAYSKNLGLSQVSTYKRKQLQQVVHRQLMNQFDTYCQRMGTKQLNLIVDVAEKGGLLDKEDVSASYDELFPWEEFSYKMFLYPFDRNKRQLALPREFLNKVKAWNKASYKKRAREIDRVLKAVRSCVYYYGMITVDDAYKQIHEVLFEELELETFRAMVLQNVIADDALYMQGPFIVYANVSKPDYLWEKIEAQYQLNPSLHKRPLSAAELQSVDDTLHYVETEAVIKFKCYMTARLQMSLEDIRATLIDLFCYMDFVERPQSLLPFIEQSFNEPKQELLQELVVYVQHIYHWNRQWRLHGYSPKELDLTELPIRLDQPNKKSKNQRRSTSGSENNITAVNFVTKTRC